jgi:hypothetical protein
MNRKVPLRWLLFAAWSALGAAWSFALFAIASTGLFILPVALIGTVPLARQTPRGEGRLGPISGLGLAPVYVAYLNRHGPGNVCSQSAAGQNCFQAWNPWPWAATVATLLAAGVIVFLVLHHLGDGQPTITLRRLLT